MFIYQGVLDGLVMLIAFLKMLCGVDLFITFIFTKAPIKFYIFPVSVIFLLLIPEIMLMSASMFLTNQILVTIYTFISGSLALHLVNLGHKHNRLLRYHFNRNSIDQ